MDKGIARICNASVLDTMTREALTWRAAQQQVAFHAGGKVLSRQTGSYEQASYAIQDTADMVAKHYGRFLPQDKAALAARILHQVWEAA